MRSGVRGLSSHSSRRTTLPNGTSSRSSRLIHGGVRYLEHGHLHLVFESSAERRRLLRLAPHLVRPLEFTWPVYEGARIPRWKLGAGLMLYDALSLFRNVGRHRRLSRAAFSSANHCSARRSARRRALLRRRDERRAIHARERDRRGGIGRGRVESRTGDGAAHIKADELPAPRLRDALQRAHGRRARERRGQRDGSVERQLRGTRSSAPTTAASTALRGSKGAHVAVPRARVGNNDALTLLSPDDGRVLFVLPAQTHAIVGTTDTLYDVFAGRCARDERDVAISSTPRTRSSRRTADCRRRGQRMGWHSSLCYRLRRRRRAR